MFGVVCDLVDIFWLILIFVMFLIIDYNWQILLSIIHKNLAYIHENFKIFSSQHMIANIEIKGLKKKKKKSRQN